MTSLILWLILAIAVYAGFAAFCFRGLHVAKRGDYWVGDDDEAECLDALAAERRTGHGSSIMRAMKDFGGGTR